MGWRLSCHQAACNIFIYMQAADANGLKLLKLITDFFIQHMQKKKDTKVFVDFNIRLGKHDWYLSISS